MHEVVEVSATSLYIAVTEIFHFIITMGER
jgi:hypothetical protein